MKQYLNITLVILLLAGTVCGCKKNDGAPPKDYSASIKDKTWWGSLNYTNDTTQYYSVHFNVDNTLLWSQLSGDYAGHWVLNNKTLTMTFNANNAQINADITEDDKMANISDNTTYYEIKSGSLITNPNISLDNTIWNGYVYPIISSGTLTPLKLSFLPGNAIMILNGGKSYGPYAYTRSASGAVIKTTHTVINPYYTDPFFCVITSATEMKGSDAGPAWRWNTIKQ